MVDIATHGIDLERHRKMVRVAIRESDSVVIVFGYKDSKGIDSIRTVSPMYFAGESAFTGLCMQRSAPRRFRFDRMTNVRFALASDVLLQAEV